MNHKVILADDSPTIQKVIKITLADQPFEITDCSSEAELFKSLKLVNPEIVFLDFGLSETQSGYDLCSQIKSQLPNTKVLLLLGTFDALDENLFQRCGASDKVVKPFDSNKFISICKHLVSEKQTKVTEIPSEEQKFEVSLPKDEDLEFPDVISSRNDSDLDNWEMSSGQKLEVETPDLISEKTALPETNLLEREINDWGMSVPGVINKLDSSDIPELPNVIASKKSEPIQTSSEAIFPDTSDLDYPDLSSISINLETTNPTQKSDKKPAAQLVSIDSFKEVPLELEIQGNYVEDLADIKSIEDQIKDEVEADLWQADEFENIKKEVTSKIEEVQIYSEDVMPSFEASKTKQPIATLDNKLLEEIVKKCVKEYMDQMFKDKIEKISWEVIPDLAENLIRQELSKITTKVIND